MKQAKPTDYLVPKSAWEIDGHKGLSFGLSMDGNGYYTYDSVKALPEVVEYDGRLYCRTGWDSDEGEVFYKETSADKLARPPMPQRPNNDGAGSAHGLE
jgi:hypothetical protein